MNFPPPTEKQARIIWLAVTGLAIATLVGLVGLLILGLKWVVNVLPRCCGRWRWPPGASGR